MVLMLCSCKSEAPKPGDRANPAPASGAAVASQSDASLVASSVDAANSDAGVTRPTEAQALEAAKRWIAAVATNKPDALIEASAVPITMTDLFTNNKCATGVVATAPDLAKTARCFQKADKLRKTLTNEDRPPDFEVSLDLPEPPPSIGGDKESWTSFVAVDQQPAHAFVRVAASDPRYPADVLYGLLAIRLVDARAKVDGALLVFASEGD